MVIYIGLQAIRVPSVLIAPLLWLPGAVSHVSQNKLRVGYLFIVSNWRLNVSGSGHLKMGLSIMPGIWNTVGSWLLESHWFIH